MKRLLLIFLVLFQVNAEAGLYKCKVGGKLIFSDRKCSADAKVITLKPTNSASTVGDPLAMHQHEEQLKVIEEKKRIAAIELQKRMEIERQSEIVHLGNLKTKVWEAEVREKHLSEKRTPKPKWKY